MQVVIFIKKIKWVPLKILSDKNIAAFGHKKNAFVPFNYLLSSKLEFFVLSKTSGIIESRNT